MAILHTLLRLFRGRPIQVPGTSRLPEGEARKIEVGDVAAGGTQVILCRVGGTLHALDSRCPHEGGRLQAGKLHEGKYAHCPLHNYLFDPKDGRAVRGACGKAKTYKVAEREDEATIWM